MFSYRSKVVNIVGMSNARAHSSVKKLIFQQHKMLMCRELLFLVLCDKQTVKFQQSKQSWCCVVGKNILSPAGLSSGTIYLKDNPLGSSLGDLPDSQWFLLPFLLGHKMAQVIIYAETSVHYHRPNGTQRCQQIYLARVTRKLWLW